MQTGQHLPKAKIQELHQAMPSIYVIGGACRNLGLSADKALGVWRFYSFFTANGFVLAEVWDRFFFQ